MKNEQINKQSQIPYRWAILGIFFTMCGVMWLYFRGAVSTPEYLISGLLILLGTIIALYSLYEIIQYKRTGEVRIRIDERTELNTLKASKKGFIFLVASIAILIALLGFDIIDEQIFSSLIEVAFAAGFIIYMVSYYLHERDDEKTDKMILTLTEIGLGILMAFTILIGPAIIQEYIFPPMMEHVSIDHEICSAPSVCDEQYNITNQTWMFKEDFISPETHGLILEARLYSAGTGKGTEDKPFGEETTHSEIWDAIEIYRINSSFWKMPDYDGYIIWIQVKGKIDTKPLKSLKTRVKINNGVIIGWAPVATFNVEKNKEYELSLERVQYGDNILDIRQKYFMEQGKFGVDTLKEDEFETGWKGKTNKESYVILGLEVKVPKGEKPDILVNSELFA
ncbi:MAG: hypothetical protein CVT88_01005 [Candidatus Altiarchaeales archaeon HGW-Altiarchaeales-1]|nr:MAG: hypothetical protein CVT88_01005 [Candidatus Altiarchaeales archaeon HGW-Altiarchaeales-1]